MTKPKLAFSDKYFYKLPEGHRFPIDKYELVKEQLIYEGTITPDNIFDPGLIDQDIILLTHTPEYWNKLKNLQLSYREIRKIGLPVTEISVKRARNSVAGTVASADIALEEGVGMNLAGGTHHAYADHGEGFCALNDIAIASNYLLHGKKVSQILVVDLDVHQGNGTAAIFKDEPRVFTFSAHGANNYPLNKEKSDLDIAIPAGTTDEIYLNILYDHVPKVIEKVQPDIIFYQSGVDILHSDKLGKLAITKNGCKARDELVISHCKSSQIPLVITMGGGYTARLADLVDAHCNTFRSAIHHYFD
ncbi:MAG: histone deacetylase family protein [Candidatus Cyclobacteriaceae bacterium M2_1C_046]